MGEILAFDGVVIASELTVLETDRAIRAGEARGRLGTSESSRLRERLEVAKAQWGTVGLSPELLAGARRGFPVEPVRALDAIHLASALAAREGTPDLRILSLDQRVRRNAEALGFEVVP